MAFDGTKLSDIIDIMDAYITSIRPPEHIRPKLDFSYEIVDQSIILNEIRPQWSDPTKIISSGYARATYVNTKEIWKIFWMRADLKWHSYKPNPQVDSLEDFLAIVRKDEYGCFNG